jgi:hypothetical protein
LALRSAQQGCGNRASQGTSAALAAKSYDILLDQKQGFSREAAIDLEGVRTVLALRSQYGEPKKFLDERRNISISDITTVRGIIPLTALYFSDQGHRLTNL